MTAQDTSGPNRLRADEDEDPEVAMRDARQRFIAAFPKRSDSIGLLLGMVSTLGARGPVAPLQQIVHRMAGLAGTLGFPTVSARAAELETMLIEVEQRPLDTTAADRLFELIGDAFATDLAQPPSWARTTTNDHRQSGKILIVEDDEDQREVVAIHLRGAGHDIAWVASGDVVVETARAHHPSLILMDANLPGIDGYSACRLLKADPELSHIPIIFMTVRATLDDKLVGLMLGADDYLVKPIDMAELLLRIQLLLARRHAKAAVREPAPASHETAELDYESFVAVGREQLAILPCALVLIKVPDELSHGAHVVIRGESRRRDLVTRYDKNHIVMLMAEMPPAKAQERLEEMMAKINSPGTHRVHAGIAASSAAGAKSIETLLAEADEAAAQAGRSGQVVLVSGQVVPVASDAPAPARPPEPSRSGPRRATVVLADDDPEVSRIVDAQMRAAGYKTTLAYDGEQALAAVASQRPDVLVMDMMMPKMTGFDVLTKLRQSKDYKPLIVVLSARGREQDVTRAFELGADDYITKPFSPQELLARVARLLR